MGDVTGTSTAQEHGQQSSSPDVAGSSGVDRLGRAPDSATETVEVAPESSLASSRKTTTLSDRERIDQMGTARRPRGQKRPFRSPEDNETLSAAWPALKQVLLAALDRIQKRDVYGIFAEPVDPIAVPGYLDIIKEPMDLGTIRRRIEDGAYTSFTQLVRDCDLVWRNCFYFNPPESIFYKAGEVCKQEARRAWKHARERMLRLKEPAVRDAAERFLHARPPKKRPIQVSNSNGERNECRLGVGIASEKSNDRDGSLSVLSNRPGQEVVSKSIESSGVPTTVRFRASGAGTDPPFPSEDTSPQQRARETTSASAEQLGQDRSETGSLSTVSIRISFPRGVAAPATQIEEEPAGASYRSDSRQRADPAEASLLVGGEGSGGPRYTKQNLAPNTAIQRHANWMEVVRQQNMLWPPLLGRISSSFLLLQETMGRDWMRYQRQLRTVLPTTVAGTSTSGGSADGAGANHSPRVATSYRQLLSQVSRKLHSWTGRTHTAMSVTGVSSVPLQTDLAAMDPHHAASHNETKHSTDHDSMPASWLYHPNPCRPLQGRRYMTLAAYAHSMHQFIHDAGDMAYRIVDELLSPDAERERLVKQWRLEVAAWEKRLEEAQEARMEDFDQACQSFRDKVWRLQQDGVDLDWLRDTVFDAELAEQVESVPLDTIDDSTPYGVSARELRALRDYLWERTNTHGKRIPWLDAMIQLSEQQPPPGRTWSPKGFLSSAMDTSYQERLSKSVAGTNSATDQTWRDKQAAGRVRSQATSDQAAARPHLSELSQTPNPVAIATSGINQTNSSHRSTGKTGPTIASSSVPASDAPLCCANCGTADTPGWRQGETKDQRLCNACGLFWVKYKRHRPPNLWRQGSRSTKPVLKPSATTPANATTNSGPHESTSMSR